MKKYSWMKNFKWVGILEFVPSVRYYRDDSKYGYDSDGQNFNLKLHHDFQKMVLISFKDLHEIHIFPKYNPWYNFDEIIPREAY